MKKVVLFDIEARQDNKMYVERVLPVARKFEQSNYQDMKLSKELIELVDALVVRCIVKMATTEPFMFNILSSTKRVVSYSLHSAIAWVSFDGVDIVLGVNPVLLCKEVKNSAEIIGVLMHEGYHILYEHCLGASVERMPNGEVSNIATDCEINQYVINQALQCRTVDYQWDLPEGGVDIDNLEQRYNISLQRLAGSYYYYEELMKVWNKENKKEKDKNESEASGEGQSDSNDQSSDNTSNNGQNGNGQGTNGKSEAEQSGIPKDGDGNNVYDKYSRSSSHDAWGLDGQGKQSKISDSLKAEIIRGVVNRAYNELSTESRGLLPGHIKAQLEVINKRPSVNWKTLVKRGVGKLPIGKEPTKRRLNRRRPEALYLSGKKAVRMATIIVFIDTSGSMSNEEIAYSLGEVLNIVKTLKCELYVVQIDTSINKIDKVKSRGELAKFQISGRGGTYFQPAYDWLLENKYTNMNSFSIYFTDGFGESSVNTYGYENMVWTITGDEATVDNFSLKGKQKRVALLKDDPKLNNRRVK